ncbi:polysaccharide biosynthesis protein GtrA [Parazoarcus communis]|uniref:Polysaccharide biosynthesis protein GtrA n=1 Tax=Parazoarcus communis TaxID=41977 RepID=A0A2U8GY85_9RHOO|nr:GtrA family protein [Parazoarcus communis]AWI78360.1 polysaccharide biosynthesis protein GtrA [Parazoarcus communis]
MIARAELIRFVRFAAVGLVGTAAHYALLLVLVEMGGAPPISGSVAGFLLGAMVNYAINHRFVFRSGRAHAEALPRFMTVAGVGLCWNALLMYLLTNLMGLHYLLAQVLTTGLLLVWHYVGNAVWTFRRDKAGGV